MKLFLDTDLNFPSDDFQSLLLLLAEERVELLGCGAAAGNTWAEEVAANLGQALALVGRAGVPIHAGRTFTSFQPSMASARELRERRARSFIGAFEKSDSPRPWVLGAGDGPETQAAAAIAGLARRHPGELAVACLGPLTNLADALAADPAVAGLLRRVWVMGGHFQPDGTEAERPDFNVWFDPVAAAAVFGSGAPVTLLPLEVCAAAAVHPGFVSQVCEFHEGAAGLFVDDFLGMVEQHGSRMPLWDQLLALVLLDPDVVTARDRGWIEVIRGHAAGGRTAFRADPAGPVELVRAVDRERVRDALLRRVAGLREVAYCRAAAFATPRFLYHAQEILERLPLHFLESRTACGGYVDLPAEVVRSAGRFAERADPLVELLRRAKERGELWPPAPRADAANTAGTPLDHEAVKEMEGLFFRRFAQVVAVAVAAGDDGVPHGFTCLAPLTPARRLEMGEQYGVELPEFGYITEFGLVDRAHRGNRAFEHLNARLFAWCCDRHPGAADIPVFGIVLETQKACRTVIGRFGYEEVGYRVISEGPEAGRVLRLFRHRLLGS